MALAMGGGGGLVDLPAGNGAAGPSTGSPVNGIGAGLSANVSTNAGGSLVGGVTLAFAALILVVYLATRGRQH